MIEKQIVEILTPLADRIIELEKQLAAIAMRPIVKSEPVDVQAIAREAAKILPVPENGKDGANFKSVTVTDGRTMTIELTDGAEFEVELPIGPAGMQGERGEKGADGLGIEIKAWTPGVYRADTYRATDLGRIYKAVRDTASEPGSSVDWERVGAFGFAWTGLKKADHEYQDGDLYIDNGSAFLWFGGKGHMFCRQGARGAQGDAGKDGRDGKDAPTLVHMQWIDKSLNMVMSDGSVFEAEIEGYQKAIADLSREIVHNFLEERDAATEAQGGTPVKSFRGPFVRGDSYSKGDLVTFNKSMWVARASTKGEFSDQVWRQMVTVVNGGGAMRLQDMADINKHSTPALGNVPIWSYTEGHKDQAQFVWGSPNAHLKNWDSVVHWESGTTVFYNGELWRATSDNTNVEPKHEDGRATIFMNAPGEPSFGIVPSGISSAPPAAGTDVAGPKFKFAYWVQYVDATNIHIWKFKIHRVDRTTGQTYGEWIKQTWPTSQFRGIHAPHTPPPGFAVLWLYGRQDSTKPPVVGQQSWSSLDFSNALGNSIDVTAPAPADGDILVYNAATHKWTATAGRTWFTSMQTSP